MAKKDPRSERNDVEPHDESPQPALHPGDVVAGRYILLEEIGRGGFGVVFRAVQKGVNRHVALKALSPNKPRANFDFAAAFHNEALHTSRLSHPNTITLFDYGETPEGWLYLVTELLHGETLRMRLSREKVLSAQRAVHIARQVAKSLAEAHSLGIVHGDLKPENIFLLDLHGEPDFVKLLDFGIARLVGEASQTLMGTPEYMSPEHFTGRPLMPASDIYSAGLILYEMVIGRPPYQGHKIDTLFRSHVYEPLPDMPTRIERGPLGRAIRRATNKEPSERFLNGLAFMEVLGALKSLRQTQEPVRSAHIAVPGFSSREVKPPPRESKVVVGDLPSAVTGPLQTLDTSSHDDGNDEGWRPPALGASRRLSARQRLPLVGRRDDRRWLLEHITLACEARRGRIVLLGGVYGSGKTRLARWLAYESPLSDTRAAIGFGRCVKEAPLEAFSEALVEALTPNKPDDHHSNTALLTEEVERRLERSLSEGSREALRALMSVREALDTARWLRDLADVLVCVAEKGPLLLVIDDLHLADEATRSFLGELAWLVERRPCALMIVGTLSREALSRFAGTDFAPWLVEVSRRHRSVLPRQIAAMSLAEAETLARLFLGADMTETQSHGAASVKLVSLIAARSCGNPRYIEALVGYLKTQKLLANTIDGIGLRSEAEREVVIPPDLIEPLYAPVRRFCGQHPEGERLEALLQICAVLGEPFSRGLVLRTFEGERSDLGGMLDALVKADLLIPTRHEGQALRAGTSFTFAQPLLLQVLDHQISICGETVELHRRAATAKRDYYAAKGTLGQHIEEINRHRVLAGDTIDLDLTDASTSGSMAGRPPVEPDD